VAVKVPSLPVQVLAGVADATRIGAGPTGITTVPESTQTPEVYTTVYVPVAAAKLSEFEITALLPSFQLMELANEGDEIRARPRPIPPHPAALRTTDVVS
jgi:hypothetical protein